MTRDPTPPAELYTLGYEKRTLAEYLDILGGAGVSLLVDVRQVAWSHKPGFSKKTLAAALEERGIGYVHAVFAGNPKELRRASATMEDALRRYREHLEAHPGIVEEFVALIAAAREKGQRVCITCFERDVKDCHRGILAEQWRLTTRGAVRHL